VAAAVRFLVEWLRPGMLVARGIDVELAIEAETLSALERRAHEVIHDLFGAERGVTLLVGTLRRRRGD
jgi:hypothetical protein